MFKMHQIYGATPVDPNEIAGMIPTYISTQGELNAAEQANIQEGEKWAFARKRKDLFTESFLRELHREMFGLVWKWAGTYRTTNKSIGVEWTRIPVEVKKLLDDTKYWVENQTYPWDELVVRFHHRLVWIHPFPNGNGRHARVMADLILFNFDQPLFTWGALAAQGGLDQHGLIRQQYIRALQLADSRDFKELMQFVRT